MRVTLQRLTGVERAIPILGTEYLEPKSKPFQRVNGPNTTVTYRKDFDPCVQPPIHVFILIFVYYPQELVVRIWGAWPNSFDTAKKGFDVDDGCLRLLLKSFAK
jgi:hypothetical protein